MLTFLCAGDMSVVIKIVDENENNLCLVGWSNFVAKRRQLEQRVSRKWYMILFVSINSLMSFIYYLCLYACNVVSVVAIQCTAVEMTNLQASQDTATGRVL